MMRSMMIVEMTVMIMGKRTDEPVIMTVMIDSNQGNITLSLNGLISRWCTPTKCTFISISSPF